MNSLPEDQSDCILSTARTRVIPLHDAVQRYVERGQHLHFASTPSRANAAIRELGRQFADKEPAFTLSTTGFHSSAHLLGLLGLGRRYIACFFGDNYPSPRPNALYSQLEDDGVDLEQWSLGSYVAAFRAGARGEPCAIVNSLAKSDLGRDLARRGLYVESADPFDAHRRLGFVRSLRADVAFLHAVIGDEDGNAVFSPPSCESFHAALGATRGVIITVERIVSRGELARYPNFIPIPSHRVLAICEAPKGAHPQPLHVVPEELRELAYGDDYHHYELWRRMTRDMDLFRQFRREVLDSKNDAIAYREFVRSSKQPSDTSSFRRHRTRPTALSTDSLERSSWQLTTEDARTTILAARSIVRRVTDGRMTAVLAGIGQSFTATRLAKACLRRRGCFPELLVETGLSDFEPLEADEFLLGHRNIAASRRLTDVDHVLGALVCGNGSRCLGVIGAAQVDRQGNINSTRVNGRFLVGSGGANDIASAADEVIVVTRALPERFPETVEYITSPGVHALSIVTDWWELERTDSESPWRIRQWIAEQPNACGPSWLPAWAVEDCAVPCEKPPTNEELEMLELMFRNGSVTHDRTHTGNPTRSTS